MSLIVSVFGVFVAGLGAAGMAAPGRLLSRVTRAQARVGAYGLAAFRLVMGGVLLLAAPGSRAPLYLLLLGGLSLLSAALTVLLGARRFEAALGWWRGQPAWAVRAWSAFACAFGLSLVWAALPAAAGAT